ncbi:type II toxin-antitoxin system VapC family toxin [Candidatus Woesearchaeota archaeon]|nr:type II toxin-antitoxin system VapC family toxin [Candidatus Woesearchaeota archaeon]
MIDSWAWIEYFKGTQYGRKIIPYLDSEEEIIISSINIAEVYHFLLKNNIKQITAHIEFMTSTAFTVQLTTEIACNAAKNKFEKKLGMADAIVLSTAQYHNAKIITGDNDFKKLEKVIFIED